MTTRRTFLRTAGLTIGIGCMVPAWLGRAAAQGSNRRKILIAIFQRGAADGLNIVVPHFEKRYYEIRPSIAIPAPGTPATPSISALTGLVSSASSAAATLLSLPSNAAIDLDGRFGLHPQLRPLKPFWDSGQLAIVHAAGSHDSSRSHFDSQDFMESGMQSVRADAGWLNRAMPLASSNASPLRAVAVGTQVARTLRGPCSAVAIDDLSKFEVANRDAAAILENLYASSSDKALRAQGGGTFEAIRMIESLRKQEYKPVNGATYSGEFGRKLRQLAQLIKADVGVEVGFADIGGWDHHGNENSQLAAVLNEFGNSLAAFCKDMGDRMADIVLVTMTEFGRTAAESNGGTDHGHGGVMMVLGGAVNGTKVYGRWPGLEPGQLFEKRDLAVTTDFRDVLGELVRDHLGQKPDVAFPGFNMSAPMGLVRV